MLTLLTADNNEPLFKAANAAMFAEFRGMALVTDADTSEHFAFEWNRTAEANIAAGRALRCPDWTPKPTTPPRIGFYLMNTMPLAHTMEFLVFLSGLRQLEPRPIEPILFTHDKVLPEFAAVVGDLQICATYGKTAVRQWASTANDIRRLNVRALVHISLVPGMAFAAAARVAPRHVWWAWKWHSIDCPGVYRLAGTHPFDKDFTVNGIHWHSAYSAIPEFVTDEAIGHSKRLRGQIKAPLVFGTCSRDTKYTPEFAECVRCILDALPGSLYAYSARAPVPFLEAITGKRVKHIGWINSTVWSGAFDVYLDTFPIPGGHTVFQAMAHGKPVVWMDTSDDAEQSVVNYFKRTRADCWPVCVDADEYVKAAVMLAGNNHRLVYGTHNREWFHKHMRDEKRMAIEVCDHLLRAANEA
jgi:hypothetical protein